MDKMPIGRLTTMLDCSRNAVMTVEAVKKWIDITADMGYNTVMLYIEDTYEVKNNPYFGLARGRYSQNELRELDAYAVSKGMGLIPCIQTLAHLNALTNWSVYRKIVDCDDILLAGDERVYKLIEDMFESLSNCLTTKHINIGMDEAFMMGRGKYYNIHGDRDRKEIFFEHLQKVSTIAKQYGYTISMWSDMFFRMTANGFYLYNEEAFHPDEIKKLIPDNVEIIFWNYSSTDKEYYDSMLNAHRLISDKVWFAGGLWTWQGFAPFNQCAMNALEVALDSCERCGVKDVMITCWQEDSSECSRFAVLPSLFFVAEYVRGNRDVDNIKEKFEKKYHISFDDFMLVDLTGKGRLVNPSKYVFYNDLFNGLFDTVITDELPGEHAEVSDKLAKVVDHEEWGYLFQTMKALCDVVVLKADMGIRIRKAYQQNDMEAMKVIVSDCLTLIERMKVFYEAFRTQWYIENKGRGFDVQDLRMGGMIARVDNCTRILQDYIDNRITRIEELEEDVLDRFCREEAVKGDVRAFSFGQIYSANILAQPY